MDTEPLDFWGPYFAKLLLGTLAGFMDTRLWGIEVFEVRGELTPRQGVSSPGLIQTQWPSSSIQALRRNRGPRSWRTETGTPMKKAVMGHTGLLAPILWAWLASSGNYRGFLAFTSGIPQRVEESWREWISSLWRKFLATVIFRQPSGIPTSPQNTFWMLWIEEVSLEPWPKP